MDWVKPVKGFNHYLAFLQYCHNFRFNIATRTMYRWLRELGSGDAKDTKTEMKAGMGRLSQSEDNPLALDRRRKRAFYSTSFKASVLAAYTSVGPVRAAQQFGISEVKCVESLNSKLLQGLVMQWRRKAGVSKFTDGLAKGSKKCNNGVTVKSDEEGGERQIDCDMGKSAISVEKKMKPSTRLGVKKPFYPAELRNRVLSHYR